MDVRQWMTCLLLVASFGAMAQERNAACASDTARFCPQSQSRPAKAMDCLLDHQQEITDACYDALKQRMARQQGFQACKQDSESFCKGIEPGGGRIVRCLMDHQQEISDACYDTLAKQRKNGKS